VLERAKTVRAIGKHEYKIPFGELAVNCTILLIQIVMAFCEQGKEVSGSIKELQFIDDLNYYWILKDSAP
jgi:hypothetical protein